MDKRVLRSRQSIINAFISIRQHKELEKITVTEICRTADINKSTFYVHYRDIYDLSSKLETEVIEGIIDTIEKPENVFENPAEFTENLFRAYDAKKHMIGILFSGSRSSMLPEKIDESIKKLLFGIKPEYRDDMQKNVELTYMIYGSYYASLLNKKYEQDDTVKVLCNIVDKIMS